MVLDPEKAVEAKKDFLNNRFPAFLNIFEKRYLSREGKYMMGDYFSLADIHMAFYLLFSRLPGKEGWEDAFKQHAPNLYESVNNIVNNELSEFVKNFWIAESAF
jgi:glutathione S-transferase